MSEKCFSDNILTQQFVFHFTNRTLYFFSLIESVNTYRPSKLSDFEIGIIY